MLAIGSRAPEFTLPDQDDRTVSLSTLLNRGPLILYFYPADFTPGCTREACMLRDLHGVRRATYLIDPARQIRGAVLADFRISQHEDFIRKATLLSGNPRPIV